MQQQSLWHDNLADAIRSLCEALADERGRTGMKAVAARLWPASEVASAHRRLLHALDPDRPEKLGLDEIDLLLAWGREQGVHIVPGYLSQRHGYELTVRSVEDQRDELMREFVSSQRALEQLARRLEGLPR